MKLLLKFNLVFVLIFLIGLGATGAMILGTLIDELHRRNLRYGLATLCVGGGMGIATIVERI